MNVRRRAFRQCVEEVPELRGAFRDGLGALTGGHRSTITVRKPGRISGSVNLDEALRASQPEAARWDYGIGVRMSAQEDVAWVEVHSASSGHVTDMIAKFQWLREWLNSNAVALARMPARFVWLASGSIALQRSSPQARRIAAAGLEFPVKHLIL